MTRGVKTGHQTGLDVGRACRLFLRLKLYRILATRYKSPMGEVDIVASHGNTVIAVEVKARATREDALEFILPQQRARIGQALQDFVMRNPRFAHHNLRFDAMLGVPRHWPVHIKNAWHAE